MLKLYELQQTFLIQINLTQYRFVNCIFPLVWRFHKDNSIWLLCFPVINNVWYWCFVYSSNSFNKAKKRESGLYLNHCIMLPPWWYHHIVTHEYVIVPTDCFSVNSANYCGSAFTKRNIGPSLLAKKTSRSTINMVLIPTFFTFLIILELGPTHWNWV